VYLLLLFFCCAFSIVEWGIGSIDEELKNQRQIQLEKQDFKDENKEIKRQATMKKNKKWRTVSGYAFSQQPGQDRLVTDNLSDRFGKALAGKFFKTQQMYIETESKS
jgi:hypothetical protein